MFFFFGFRDNFAARYIFNMFKNFFADFINSFRAFDDVARRNINVKDLAEKFGETALIGAGTVLTAKQAQDCIAAGAKFIISPALNLETIKILVVN